MTNFNSVTKVFLVLVLILPGLLWAGDFGEGLPPPDVREITDSNGINMGSGTTGVPGMSVSIGTEDSGISRDSGRSRYLQDNHTGTLTKIILNAVNSKDPRELDGFSTGTYYKVDTKGNSEIFRQSGSSYQNFKETGGSLSCSSTVCTYTNKHGLIVKFSSTISNGYKQCYGGQDTDNCHDGQDAVYDNIGMQTEAIMPDGEKLTYTYRPKPEKTSLMDAYISSVQSSQGWMLKYFFGPKNMSNPDIGVFHSEVERSVTAINSSIEYCNPSAEACNNLSNNWPKVEMHAEQTLTYPNPTASEWIATTSSTITNALGHSDSYSKSTSNNPGSYSNEGYTSPAGVLTQYLIPGCAYNASTGQCISTSGAGKVKRVSIGSEYHFDYIFLSSDPEGPDGTYNVDMARFQPNSYTDKLGRKTRFTYHDQWKTRIHKVIPPDATPSVDNPTGGYTEYLYDTRGNITHIKRYPKNGGSPLVTTAGYPSSCSNQKTCNKPIYIIDENGVRRDFTYHSQSGKVQTVTRSAVNGDRAQIRYTYQQKTPKVRNSSGNLVNSTPVWKLTEVSKCMVGDLNSCVGSANEHRTVFAYNHNNLLMTSRTERTGDGSISLTTTMGYDQDGNRLWEDGPRPGSHDRTYYYYDALHRKIGETGPDPDGSGPLGRQGIRTYYNADGKVTEVRRGVVSGVSLSALNAMFAARRTVRDYASNSGVHVKDRLYAGGVLKKVIQKSYDSSMRLECEAERLNPAKFGSLPASACTLGATGPDGGDRITKFTYDATDQVTSIIKGYGTASQKVERVNNYRPDNGLLASVEDGLGNTTFYDYDEFNRLEYTY